MTYQGVSERCNAFVDWWDGEYEGYCELPKGHEGDHFDGLSWFNEDRDCTDDQHEATP